MPDFNPRTAVPIPPYNVFPGIDAPFFFGWGESLPKGYLSNPVFTVQGSVPGFFVAGGAGAATRPLDGGSDMSVNFATIQPMFSQIFNSGGNNYGETIDTGAAIAFGQLVLRYQHIDINVPGMVNNQKHIAANGAIETQTQNALNTAPDYQLVTDILTGVWNYTVGAAKTTGLMDTLLGIGHNDMVAGTDPTTMIGQIETGRTQVFATWNGLSGQTRNGPIIYTTTGSWVAAGVDVTGIPMAMTAGPRTYPRHINAGPNHTSFYAAHTGVHFDPTGAMTCGYNLGTGRYFWHVHGIRYATPSILSVTKSGATVACKFQDIFVKPLRFKTDWVTDMGNYGFLLLHNDQARCTSGSITAGVFTEGGVTTGTFAVGQTLWAANYTGLGNVSYGNTIVSSAGAGVWNLAIADTVNAGAQITGQTVEPINTPVVTADDTVTLTATNGTIVQSNWIVAGWSRGTRDAGPLTGPRGNLCGSFEFLITNQPVAYAVRDYAHAFETPIP